MKAISGKRFAKLLEQHDWQLVRANGSHHVYMKAGLPVRFSLPIHSHQDLKMGLLRHFMKLAGIEEHEL